MEPWSYVSEGKGLLFTDEMDLPVESFARSRKALIGWDLKPSADFGPVDSMEFMDFGFGDMNKKSFYGNSSMGIFSSEFGNVYGEEESGSKHSSSLMDSNSQESSLIDLKLGRLTDYRDAKDGRFFKESSVVSSCRPGLMVKKARTTSSYSHTPSCQVYGCNKDLSSSKDYHKRHKVCEAHSKTAKVIVNGIEQRFCQQCSRFHLLAEFDDGKRSCRKRLAGHNERRRKIHFKTLTEKPHKLLHSFQGTKFLGNSMPKGMSFITPNIHQGEFIYPERNVQDNQFQLVKSKEKPIYNPQYAVRIRNGQLPLKSFNGTGKQLVTGIFSSEGLNAPNVPSTVKESSWFSGSNCALSLLSAQSQNMSSHVAGIQMIRPLINQTSIKKSSGVSSSNSTGVCKTGAVAVSDACHTANFEVQPDGYFQDSDLFSERFCFPPEYGTTVDLLQLSTHLKQVERNSIQVKQENEDQFYFLTS